MRACSLALALAAVTAAAGCGPRVRAADPPPPAPPASAPTLGSMACVDDSRFSLAGTGTSAEARTRAWHLQQWQALGIAHVRHDLRWDRLEPTKGTWHWDRFDPGLADVVASGVDLIGILDYGVPWASSQTATDPFYPPDDPADFATFAGAVAARYAGKIHTYEIWNEENSGFRFWKPRTDPAAYAALLHQAAGAVHRADPAAQVVYGGLFYVPQVIEGAVPFLQESFAARPDLAQDFDAFGFHPYPPYPPSVPPESDEGQATPVDQMVGDLRAVLADHGAKDTPMLATETGWPSYGGVTEADQAAWLVRDTLWLAAEHVPLACWFTLVDGPRTGQFPPEDDFGLITWDVQANAPGHRKPAWDALETLTHQLGDLAVSERLDGRLNLGAGRYGFRLVSRDRTHWADALWAYDQAFDATVTVPEPHGYTLQVIDAVGKSVPFTRVGDAVKVAISPMPVYILASPRHTL